MSYPITFCPLTLVAPKDAFASVNVMELSHTAPNNELCSFFGMVFVHIPQHTLYWLHSGEIFKNNKHNEFQNDESIYKSKYVFGGLYDQYRLCDNYITGRGSLTHSAPEQTLDFTTRLVTMYVYAYHPFLEETPQVSITARAQFTQTLPYYVPVRRVSVLMSEADAGMHPNISIPILCRRQIIFQANYQTLNIPILKEISDTFIENPSTRFPPRYNHLAYYSYENALMCFFEGPKVSVGIIAIRRGKNITITNHPNTAKERKKLTIKPVDLFAFRLKLTINQDVESIWTLPSVHHNEIYCTRNQHENEFLHYLKSSFDLMAYFYHAHCLFYSLHLLEKCGPAKNESFQQNATSSMLLYSHASNVPILLCTKVNIQIESEKTWYYVFMTYKSSLRPACFSIYVNCSKPEAYNNMPAMALRVSGPLELLVVYKTLFQTPVVAGIPDVSDDLSQSTSFHISSGVCSNDNGTVSVQKHFLYNHLELDSVLYGYTQNNRHHFFIDQFSNKSWYNASRVCSKMNASLFVYWNKIESLHMWRNVVPKKITRHIPVILFTGWTRTKKVGSLIYCHYLCTNRALLNNK